MKLIKLLGLTTAAAVVAMAFIGASSAMATNTALCSSNEGGELKCSDGKTVTGFHALANQVILLSEPLEIECEGLMESSVLKLGAPQIGHLTKLTWINCSGGCVITTTQLGLLLMLKTALNLGAFELDGTKIEVVCLGEKCFYESIGAGHLLGAELPGFNDEPGPKGDLKTNGVTLVSEGLTDGPFCPKAFGWDAFYEFLTPLWVKT